MDLGALFGAPFLLGENMNIKYLLDYPKLDSIAGVGLRWEPGQVRNVSPEMAERLTCYTDTWAAVKESTVEPADAEEVALKEEEKIAEEPLPFIDFHSMDKAALIEFASSKYNEKFDKRQNEETIRHKVIALVAKHEMDSE